MKLSGLAVVATLAVPVAVAPPLPALSEGASKNIEVDCDESGAGKKATVSVADTTVTLQCHSTYTVDPPASSNGEGQNVYRDNACENKTTLGSMCPGATGTPSGHEGLTLKFPELPQEKAVFYIRCKKTDGDDKTCVVEVTVDAAPPADANPDGESQQGGGQQVTAQECPAAGQYITLKIEGAGATAKFTCGGGLSLIPTDSKMIFAENCTKQEDLQDLERSDTKNVFTLTATKKPPKKKLCYLCGKPGAADAQKKLRTAEFCAVYVETGAGTKLLSRFTFSLMLSCVATALQFS
uniref:SRS domain-containing protein n=1 Tax=Sarcocystis aucheniae TaxID=65407 RepID=A0A5P9S3L8_9APIC|nr:hypothetical protein [Sarcocystis aucheniae]